VKLSLAAKETAGHMERKAGGEEIVIERVTKTPTTGDVEELGPGAQLGG
jgi:hypothetical protein